MTELILGRCRSIAPELLDADGEFEVLSVQIGLRPSRHGGPRIEIEALGDGEEGNQAPRFICHNYGHHSAGYASKLGFENYILITSCRYEGSVGLARTAVDMVMHYLDSNIER